MSKGWMVIAVCGLGLVLPAPALAQLPGGGAPGCPSDGQCGPPPLSDDGTNAFGACPNPCEGWCFGFGTQALRRLTPAHGPVGLVEPTVPGAAQSTTAVVPVTFQMTNGLVVTTNAPVTATIQVPTVALTGIGAPAGSPTFGDFNSADPILQFGFEGRLAYRFGKDAVEFEGFYIPEIGPAKFAVASAAVQPVPATTVTAITNVTRPAGFGNSTVVTDAATLESEVAAARTPVVTNRLDLPFFNPPPGFGGSNGVNLFEQANRVAVQYRNSLGSAEVNYRNFVSDQVQLLCGIRYLDQREALGILVDDNVPSAGNNTANIASYEVITENRLLLGQIGMEFDLPLWACLHFGGFFKAGFGADDLQVDVALSRGDGLVGFASHRDHVQFTQMYEGGLFLDFNLFERVRFHAGYNILWLVDVAEAFQQVDFDLLQQLGSGRNHNTAFYHGPVLEFEFVF